MPPPPPPGPPRPDVSRYPLKLPAGVLMVALGPPGGAGGVRAGAGGVRLAYLGRSDNLHGSDQRKDGPSFRPG